MSRVGMHQCYEVDVKDEGFLSVYLKPPNLISLPSLLQSLLMKLIKVTVELYGTSK